MAGQRLIALNDEASPTASASQGRIRALDGLRALAVTGVLLFHHGLSWARGAYLGVDLFFVLSGFLIARNLLLEGSSTGHINLRRFWANRLRRLLPALLVTLLGVLAYTALWAPPTQRHAIKFDVFASLGYVLNWRFIFEEVGYFAASGPPSPVRHLWSLSVEEQFYVIFPLLLVCLRRRSNAPHVLTITIVSIVVAGTCWTGLLAFRGADATRLYEGTDTRLASLMIGVLAAITARTWTRAPRRLGACAVVASVVAVGIAVTARGDARWMYPVGQTAFAAAAAVIVVACATAPHGRAIHVLSSAPLVWLGVLSYNLYLWHWPVYLTLTPDRLGLEGLALLSLRVALSLALAVLSYYVVERPIRTHRVRLAHPGYVAAAAILAIAALTVLITRGAPSTNLLVKRSGPAPTIHAPRIPQGFADLDLPPAATLPPPAPRGHRLRVALVGDSVGFTLGYLRPEMAGVDLMPGGTIVGCGVMAPAVSERGATVSEDCRSWRTEWARALGSKDGVDVVLMVTGAWEIRPHWIGDRRIDPGTAAAQRFVDGQLEQAYRVIRSKTRARIGALKLSCAPFIDLGIGEPPPAWTNLRLVRWYNDRLADLARRHPGEVVVLSIDAHVCPDGVAVDKVDGARLRSDGLHWTEEGATWAWRWILPLLFDLAYRPSRP